jgi:RHS Repeat
MSLSLLDGNLVESVDPDNHVFTYSYDADNELTGVGEVRVRPSLKLLWMHECGKAIN